MSDDVIMLSSESSAPPSPELCDIQDAISSKPNYECQNSEESGFSSLASSIYSKRPVHALSDSDDSVTTIPSRQTTHDFSDDDDDLPVVSLTQKYDKAQNVMKEKPSPPKVRKCSKSPTKFKNRNQGEPARRKKADVSKEDKQRAKQLKAAAAETRRVYKPGECIKYVRIFFDQELLLTEYGASLLVALQEVEIQYTIQQQVSNQVVTWSREVPEHFMDDVEGVQVRMGLKSEDQVLVVKPWNEIVNLVHNMELQVCIQSIISMLPDKKMTLVIYGIENYFRFQNTQTNRKVRSQVRGTEPSTKNCKKDREMENMPKITRKMLEEALVELELFLSCNCRCVETPQDFGNFVAQFTKAIAERPFKLDKQRKEQEKLDWFATADSRDCVPVDKNGNGLARLWKQQLCQFDLATLDTAEAISSVYQSPQALVQAYANCSSRKDGELLLRDIPIRRGLGPLTSVRRIGPELSKKIYVFFTAEDGEMQLSCD